MRTSATSATAPGGQSDEQGRRGAELRADPERHGDREHEHADRYLPRALGDERSRQQRASLVRQPASQQQHPHGVAAARRHEAAGTGTRHPGGDRVAPPQAATAVAGGRARARTSRVRASPGWPGAEQRRARANRRPRFPSTLTVPARSTAIREHAGARPVGPRGGDLPRRDRSAGGEPREQLVEARVGLVHPALHARAEHAVALLGRVEERGRLRPSCARRGPRTSAVSTETWPGIPSHSNVCTMRSGGVTSR